MNNFEHASSSSSCELKELKEKILLNKQLNRSQNKSKQIKYLTPKSRKRLVLRKLNRNKKILVHKKNIIEKAKIIDRKDLTNLVNNLKENQTIYEKKPECSAINVQSSEIIDKFVNNLNLNEFSECIRNGFLNQMENAYKPFLQNFLYKILRTFEFNRFELVFFILFFFKSNLINEICFKRNSFIAGVIVRNFLNNNNFDELYQQIDSLKLTNVDFPRSFFYDWIKINSSLYNLVPSYHEINKYFALDENIFINLEKKFFFQSQNKNDSNFSNFIDINKNYNDLVSQVFNDLKSSKAKKHYFKVFKDLK